MNQKKFFHRTMRRWSLSAIIFPLRFEGWAIRWFLEMAANIGTAEWHVFFLSFSPIAQRTPNRTSQRAQTHAHRQRRQWPSIIYRIRVSHHKLISTQNVIATSIVRTHWQRTHRELPAKPAKKTSTLDCRKCVFFSASYAIAFTRMWLLWEAEKLLKRNNGSRSLTHSGLEARTQTDAMRYQGML